MQTNATWHTERLRLRRFSEADAGLLFELDNDPAVMRYINGGDSTPLAVIEAEILPTFIKVDPARPGFGFWAASERVSGEFVGWFSLRPTPENPSVAVLGYRLKQSAWGRGLATEGAAALIERAFHRWGVTRITATTYEENLASRRVLEKLGFTLVRRFRFTEADLTQSDTSHHTSTELWPGDDLEYALDKFTPK